MTHTSNSSNCEMLYDAEGPAVDACKDSRILVSQAFVVKSSYFKQRLMFCGLKCRFVVTPFFWRSPLVRTFLSNLACGSHKREKANS